MAPPASPGANARTMRSVPQKCVSISRRSRSRSPLTSFAPVDTPALLISRVTSVATAAAASTEPGSVMSSASTWSNSRLSESYASTIPPLRAAMPRASWAPASRHRAPAGAATRSASSAKASATSCSSRIAASNARAMAAVAPITGWEVSRASRRASSEAGTATSTSATSAAVHACTASARASSIVTHNMQQAARVSQQCAFFLAEQGTPGHIVEHGPTDQMFNEPIDPRTADYVNGRFG